MNYPFYIVNTNSNEDKRRFTAICKILARRGYKQEEINQAVAATTLAGDRVAAAWLCNHSNDPSLGGASPREFYLHLCPVGSVESSFQEFWSRYRAARGWCASMDFMPHATIVEPFEVSPSSYLDLLRAYNTAARLFSNRRLVKRLRLVPSNFNDNHLRFVIEADQALLDLAGVFLSACERVGIRVTARQPPHLLSLCCDFQQAQYLQVQKEISEHFRLDPDTRAVLPDPSDAAAPAASASGAWQLRLLSRDVRLKNGLTEQLYPLYRMSCERPLAEDCDGDLHYSSTDRVALVGRVNPPKHSWGLGFNVETGVMGNFPLLCAQRIPCCEAWTLHRVTDMQCNIGLVGSSLQSTADQQDPSVATGVVAIPPSNNSNASCSASSSSSSSATTASGNEATPTQSVGLALMSNGANASATSATPASAAATTASTAPYQQLAYRGASSNGSGSCSGDSFDVVIFLSIFLLLGTSVKLAPGWLFVMVHSLRHLVFLETQA
ncbi:hypothetical protein BOX15_Mlig023827g1 [Macrostomum lignano]|uniref:Uncharacterized protein n=1 Tax=Macrostomum lignano TaxID=282301 RepID=A0A267FF22_9PLAT|nr:hypothetical protein BOX15_Mlig023827g1 [Macrostomum lignano]